MNNCIFCKIIRREIPSYRVYENDFVYAFLDIDPTTDGHTLVIPKRHTKDICSIDENEAAELMKGIKKVAHVLTEKLDCGGVNILQSNREAAQQEVPHIHFHLIPRKEHDGLNIWPKKIGDKNKLKEVYQKISS